MYFFYSLNLDLIALFNEVKWTWESSKRIISTLSINHSMLSMWFVKSHLQRTSMKSHSMCVIFPILYANIAFGNNECRESFHSTVRVECKLHIFLLKSFFPKHIKTNRCKPILVCLRHISFELDFSLEFYEIKTYN